MPAVKSPPIANKLLAALPKKEYQALQSRLEETPLVFEEFIYRPNELISDVYFPNSGIISLLAGVNAHGTLEVGLVGNEGMLGLSVFLGVNSSGNRAVVQGAGSAMKMKATALRKQCDKGGALPRLLQRYAHSVLTQVTQSAVCNQFHSVDARLARWLLMTHDRMHGQDFELSHEFLAVMLGVARPSVSIVAATLQDAGLIRYKHGHVTVKDRKGLEDAACVCYPIMRGYFESLRP